jgi:hypothetical protein
MKVQPPSFHPQEWRHGMTNLGTWLAIVVATAFAAHLLVDHLFAGR